MDLPLPDSPKKPTTSPGKISRFIFDNEKFPPLCSIRDAKDFWIFFISISGKLDASCCFCSVLLRFLTFFSPSKRTFVYELSSLSLIFLGLKISNTFPLFITAIRSAVACKRAILWLTKITVSPRWRLRSIIKSMIFLCVLASNAVVGSSAIKRSGS